VPEADAERGAGLPVGEYLREVRISRGLQLEDASHVTKIGKNYLAAIEEGQFDKLPNAAYIKGFLRLYAGFLELSGDEVVRRYEQGLPAARPPVEISPEPERPGVEIMERAKLGGHGRWVIPVLLLGLVILAALFFSDGEEKRTRPSSKTSETPAAPPARVAVQPQRSTAVRPVVQPGPSSAPQVQVPAPLSPAIPAAVPAPATAPGTGHRDGIILRLRFNQDSWLSITIDDSISQRYDLKAGDIIEWKGARSFVLDIGDGAAAEAEFNGRPLKALGGAGKPAHVELKSE
jgi:cytoskeleton protein RodZ